MNGRMSMYCRIGGVPLVIGISPVRNRSAYATMKAEMARSASDRM